MHRNEIRFIEISTLTVSISGKGSYYGTKVIKLQHSAVGVSYVSGLNLHL